jgi:hypothetical protein
MKKLIMALGLAVLAGLVYSADYTPASQEGATQTDTNLTIVVTGYLPAFTGQILVGTGSNTIHIAKGTTTNDWVKVSN